jgi:hypothetical protein
LTSTTDIWSILPPSLDKSRPAALLNRPVKIAVVDTGAAIEGSILEDSYDNRLIECRSWIGEDRARLIRGATADKVGHGTHATSLVLKNTENTDCEIYVAQVFEKDPHQRSPSNKGLGSTAKSIALVGVQTNALHVYSLTPQRRSSTRCSTGRST